MSLFPEDRYKKPRRFNWGRCINITLILTNVVLITSIVYLLMSISTLRRDTEKYVFVLANFVDLYGTDIGKTFEYLSDNTENINTLVELVVDNRQLVLDTMTNTESIDLTTKNLLNVT